MPGLFVKIPLIDSCMSISRNEWEIQPDLNTIKKMVENIRYLVKAP
jgi:hypothetical protein